MTGRAVVPGTTIALDVSEKSFQRMVLTQAGKRGWRFAHFLPATRHGQTATHMVGHPGFPDLVLAKAGVVLHREVKTVTGRVRPAQKDWLAALGQPYPLGVWRPTDWPRIIAELDAA